MYVYFNEQNKSCGHFFLVCLSMTYHLPWPSTVSFGRGLSGFWTGSVVLFCISLTTCESDSHTRHHADSTPFLSSVHAFLPEIRIRAGY